MSPENQELIAFTPGADAPPKKRVIGRPWPKGKSGNVLGRPRNPNPRMTSKEIRALIMRKGAPVLGSVVKQAMAGDIVAARAIFDLTLPKGRPLSVALPKVRSAASAAQMLATLLDHVADGAITPTEAASVTGVVRAYVDIAAMAKLEERVGAVESKLGGHAP